jgi:hypothetical protein
MGVSWPSGIATAESAIAKSKRRNDFAESEPLRWQTEIISVLSTYLAGHHADDANTPLFLRCVPSQKYGAALWWQDCPWFLSMDSIHRRGGEDTTTLHCVFGVIFFPGTGRLLASLPLDALNNIICKLYALISNAPKVIVDALAVEKPDGQPFITGGPDGGDKISIASDENRVGYLPFCAEPHQVYAEPTFRTLRIE